ncbi:hypothetical protein BDV97DRAFT_23930 [Delphinella strobiligena]|nr:hypothetical protein BDV97DRAFT_23930 [Delphinella strobiligena]
MLRRPKTRAYIDVASERFPRPCKMAFYEPDWSFFSLAKGELAFSLLTFLSPFQSRLWSTRVGRFALPAHISFLLDFVQKVPRHSIRLAITRASERAVFSDGRRYLNHLDLCIATISSSYTKSMSTYASTQPMHIPIGLALSTTVSDQIVLYSQWRATKHLQSVAG